MSMRSCMICLLLLFSYQAYARDSTDVLVMKNGDRLTCKIKGLHDGVLYVGLPYVIETLSVDWAQVAHLESRQEFFVRLENGSVYRGALNSTEVAAESALEIRPVEEPRDKVVAEKAHVVGLAMASDKFLQRFNGGLSFGTMYAKANETVQYTITGLASYPRERWVAQAGLSSTLSSASGTPTSTRNQENLSGMHLLRWNNYYLGGVSSFLQSTEQSIALQTTVGSGLGRYFKNTNQATVGVLGGMAWQNTRYTANTSSDHTQNVATALVSANASLFRFNKTTLDLRAVFMPALSDPGRVYFSTNSSYYIKITGNLSWDLSFYGNWDTRPPRNLSGSDYGTSSGLSWTFGSSLRTAPSLVQ